MTRPGSTGACVALNAESHRRGVAGADPGVWQGQLPAAWRCSTGANTAIDSAQPSPVKGHGPTSRKGPFIVVSGHDPRGPGHQLLEQTDGHRCPCLHSRRDAPGARLSGAAASHPHLAGNFGTAWQSQQKEFADIPAPILFTTNCLMPPRPSYQDRVYDNVRRRLSRVCSTSPRARRNKDFSPIIEQALELGGYAARPRHERHKRRPYADDRLCAR